MRKKVANEVVTKDKHLAKYKEIRDKHSISFEYGNPELGVSNFNFNSFYLASRDGVLFLMLELFKATTEHRDF